MKEKELLRAIQSADRAFFDEAEQRALHAHRRKENPMKSRIVHTVMTGASIAAALAICAGGGILIARQAASSVTAPPAGMADEIAVQTPQNCMGGSGELIFGSRGNFAYDNDNIYFGALNFTAPRTGEKFQPVDFNQDGIPFAQDECFLTYHDGKQLYYLPTDKESARAYTVDETGALHEVFSLPTGTLPEMTDAAYYWFNSITLLDNGTYFVTGVGQQVEENGDVSHAYEFSLFYDPETGATEPTVYYEQRLWAVECRQAGGYTYVYTSNHDGTISRLDVYDSDNQFVCSTPFPDTNNLMWQATEDGVYYVDTVTHSYCLRTLDSTVVLENDVPFETFMIRDNLLYSVEDSGETVYLVCSTLDRTEELSRVPIEKSALQPTVEHAGDSAYMDGLFYLADLCGNYAIIEAPYCFITVDLTTGDVQYCYEPNMLAPAETDDAPEADPEPDTPESPYANIGCALNLLMPLEPGSDAVADAAELIEYTGEPIQVTAVTHISGSEAIVGEDVPVRMFVLQDGVMIPFTCVKAYEAYMGEVQPHLTEVPEIAPAPALWQDLTDQFREVNAEIGYNIWLEPDTAKENSTITVVMDYMPDYLPDLTDEYVYPTFTSSTVSHSVKLHVAEPTGEPTETPSVPAAEAPAGVTMPNVPVSIVGSDTHDPETPMQYEVQLYTDTPTVAVNLDTLPADVGHDYANITVFCDGLPLNVFGEETSSAFRNACRVDGSAFIPLTGMPEGFHTLTAVLSTDGYCAITAQSYVMITG